MFTSVGTLGSAQDKAAAATTITFTCGRAVPVKDVVAVWGARDNTGTADGDSAVMSCSDSKGNVWTKVAEKTKGSGAADAGVTMCLFVSRITVALTTSDTITLTGPSVLARTIAGWQFTMDATATLVIQSVGTLVGTSSPGSLSYSPAPLFWHYLSLYVIGSEQNGTSATLPTGYTAAPIIKTTGGAGGTNQTAYGWFKIATVPNENPTSTTNPTGDYGCIGVLLREEFPQTDHVLNLSDTSTPSDSLATPTQGHGLSVGDLVTASDELGFAHDHNLELADTASPSDSFDAIVAEPPCVDHTPIAGQFIVGDGTLVGEWEACVKRPPLILRGQSFAVTIQTDDGTAVSLTRPRLRLLGRSFAISLSSAPPINRPQLILRARALFVPPFIRAELGRSTLILRGRATALQLSSSPTFGRPLLYLNARRLVRVGPQALIPTIPETEILVATVSESEPLVATVPEDELLVPTRVEVR